MQVFFGRTEAARSNTFDFSSGAAGVPRAAERDFIVSNLRRDWGENHSRRPDPRRQSQSAAPINLDLRAAPVRCRQNGTMFRRHGYTLASAPARGAFSGKRLPFGLPGEVISILRGKCVRNLESRACSGSTSGACLRGTNRLSMTNPPDDPKLVRLGREDQMAIARGLREWYQHVVDEGIPEHLKDGFAKLLSTELPQAHSSDQAAGSAGTDGEPDRAEEPTADPEAEPPPEGPDDA